MGNRDWPQSFEIWFIGNMTLGKWHLSTLYFYDSSPYSINSQTIRFKAKKNCHGSYSRLTGKFELQRKLNFFFPFLETPFPKKERIWFRCIRNCRSSGPVVIDDRPVIRSRPSSASRWRLRKATRNSTEIPITRSTTGTNKTQRKIGLAQVDCSVVLHIQLVIYNRSVLPKPYSFYKNPRIQQNSRLLMATVIQNRQNIRLKC